MGNKNFKLTKLALALGVTVSLAGCFSDNDNDVTVTPPDPDPGTITVPSPDTPEALSSYVSVTVTDSATGNVVDNATITFFESGAASTNVTDLDGADITSQTSADGAFAFKTKDGVTSLTLAVSAAEYLEGSAVVDLSGDDNAVNVAVNLVSKANLAVASQADLATADGKLAAALSVEANSDKGGAKLDIPTTVTLQDADGNAISGTVSVEVATADLTAEAGKASAASIIPAGLNAGNTTNVLVPAGIVTVNISAGDTAVKTLSEAVTLTTNFPETYTKADGNGLAQNDAFDVYAYDETKASWSKLDSQAVVAAKSGTVFPASFETTHFSSFVPVETVTGCSEEISFAFTGDAVPASGLNMKITSSAIDKTKIVNSASGVLYAQGTAGAAGITSSATVNVQVSDANGNVWGNASNVSLCNSSATAADIAIELDAPVTYVDQDFSLTYTCSNTDQPNNQLAFTGALVRYNQEGKAPLIAAETDGTYALTGLVSGATYEVSVIPVGVDVGDASLTVPTFTAAAGEAVSFNVGRSNCQTSTVTGSGS
ncbi:hypothetical protein N474_21545 [Pseudoalteromonas luteoviolacea CPMOR-2]|uniref:Big-1 domain-containing protein n=1 Tax=Pseudoalteromonas luteoviolacea DSM 6061 TaxID=1365250 RepID=A0A166XKX2_9GAMM|nr:hypothetical protein [Pseudoalteromonas luteoviolacea]KZN40494.1 hypothetical protein N475_11995 [Pseudoalteromonas luteoviolacea DSM 6061]KZN53109.1 hypothetical protein N474_21545 [Pseudoalteromonas luteoviolacea CPMOR-2]MBE0387363.1 hypothetical protein [Pseudoalteromonas luteoviolacea DSM 6061]